MNSHNFVNAFPIKYRIGGKADLFSQAFPGKFISPNDRGGINIGDEVSIYYECQDDIKFFRVRYFEYLLTPDNKYFPKFSKEMYYLRNRDEEKMLDDMRIHISSNNRVLHTRDKFIALKKFKEGIDDDD